MKRILVIAALALVSACTGKGVICSNREFTWTGDAIVQGAFKACAPDALTLVSNYTDSEFESGEWHLEKDLSGMPVYTAPTRLEEAIFNLALEESVKAVEPDSTLRTGVNWGSVWTRDVSYSTILGISAVQTEAAKKSLMAKVDRLGRIIQDTGTGVMSRSNSLKLNLAAGVNLVELVYSDENTNMNIDTNECYIGEIRLVPAN